MVSSCVYYDVAVADLCSFHALADLLSVVLHSVVGVVARGTIKQWKNKFLETSLALQLAGSTTPQFLPQSAEERDGVAERTSLELVEQVIVKALLAGAMTPTEKQVTMAGEEDEGAQHLQVIGLDLSG